MGAIMNEEMKLLIRYAKASAGLHTIIEEKAKGDWSKARLLIRNDPAAKAHMDEMLSASMEFRKLTSSGKFYKIPTEFRELADLALDYSQGEIKEIEELSILKDFFDYIKGAKELWDGHDLDVPTLDDDNIITALDMLMNLPFYDPDAWLRRSFLIEGVRVSPNTNLLKKVEDAYREACATFIYGQMNATCAMARSVMEAALKEAYYQNQYRNLGDFINYGWDKAAKLASRPDLKNAALTVMRAGNLSLHERRDQKVIHIGTELNTMNVLRSLKDILEYIYES